MDDTGMFRNEVYVVPKRSDLKFQRKICHIGNGNNLNYLCSKCRVVGFYWNNLVHSQVGSYENEILMKFVVLK